MDAIGFSAFFLGLDFETKIKISQVLPAGADVLRILFLRKLRAAPREDHPTLFKHAPPLASDVDEVFDTLEWLLTDHASSIDLWLFSNDLSNLVQLAPHKQAFLRKARDYVRGGNCAMALGKCGRAWLKNGFGFWTKTWVGFQLPILKAAKDAYREHGFDAHIGGLGSLVCPVKASDNVLKPHIDGPPVPFLEAKLEEFFASGKRTNTEFALFYGVQTLIHLRGGITGYGATAVLSPMTPARQLLLLRLIREFGGSEGAAFWADTHTGPKFFTPSAEVLHILRTRLRRIRDEYVRMDRLERLLAEEMFGDEDLHCNVQWTDMFPTGADKGPFAIAFPLGALHKKGPNTHGGRISLVGGIDFGPKHPGIKRRRDLVSDLGDMEDGPEAVKRVRALVKPFAGGKAHADPWFAADLFEKGGPMEEFRFTKSEAAEHMALMDSSE